MTPAEHRAAIKQYLVKNGSIDHCQLMIGAGLDALLELTEDDGRNAFAPEQIRAAIDVVDVALQVRGEAQETRP